MPTRRPLPTTLAIILLCALCEPASARPNAVLTGYWPPTNEMLRPLSGNAAQNPDGWQGADWRGLGYDVYAFFPEFPPDGDPTNDAIGAPGSVGSPDYDLPVDYQRTSVDFWRIMDTFAPRVLITTSRGGSIGWELEAIEGGHPRAATPAADPAADWASDRSGVPLPYRDSIDPRSWRAISTYRAGRTLTSRLPLAAIERAVAPLARVTVAIDRETSGNYLSGFIALHGLYYNQVTPSNVAAGHIHVGRDVHPNHARELLYATLEAVLRAHPPGPAPAVGAHAGTSRIQTAAGGAARTVPARTGPSR